VKPRRAAAAAAAVLAPEWQLDALKNLGIIGPQAASLVGKLGVLGLQAALVKIRAKRGGKNAAGLLVRKGEELAQEGAAILQAQLEQAMALAPKALQDTRWATLPEQLRNDPECQAAWCCWKATEAGVTAASDGLRAEAVQEERGAHSGLLDLLEARHPDPAGLRQRMELAKAQAPAALGTCMARRIAFWTAIERGRS
jgi:hypothetical protein